MSAEQPGPADLLLRLQQALDDLDRVRMAAGYDHRIPMVEVIADVERLRSVEDRACALRDHHPDKRVRAVAWHITTDEPKEISRV